MAESDILPWLMMKSLFDEDAMKGSKLENMQVEVLAEYNEELRRDQQTFWGALCNKSTFEDILTNPDNNKILSLRK